MEKWQKFKKMKMRSFKLKSLIIKRRKGNAILIKANKIKSRKEDSGMKIAMSKEIK